MVPAVSTMARRPAIRYGRSLAGVGERPCARGFGAGQWCRADLSSAMSFRQHPL